MSHDSPIDLNHAARRWFGKEAASLGELEQRVLSRAVSRKPVSRDPGAAFDGDQTFGARLADRVAAVGGSWAFIIAFGAFLVVWASGNLLLARHAFDPYPFIFLNLILSMLAAIQAPVIMMSQNRQSKKDRLEAAHDYEVNLKSEIEVLALHDKLDQLRSRDIETMIRKQQEQLDMLKLLIERKG
ncbi:MAG: DUF1003 domain-containing protein [Alphaproteobacteria bacterium]|nr:DUF1003 domain-containing protein [Brevundimonas sp.]MBU3970421.1 DUF1003 domain-containing protein [Alphaproteobacteria bacterium]MBU4039546.1 DUF1003 domain-containing protein [Alphaproteobacteria bacterium]MBU4136274.1 DUF1003 domain-containing protein [Alphaproteobacteria bacterium]